MRFRADAPPKKNVKAYFSDFMMVYAGASPYFYFDGYCTLVSPAAQTHLSGLLGSEVTFVPVSVDGADRPYSVLWLTTVLDVIGADSLTVPEGFGSDRLRIKEAKFIPDIQPCALRIPAWKYAANADLIKVSVAQSLCKSELTGFRFRDGVNGRLLEAKELA
jgi:hypothetical protein